MMKKVVFLCLLSLAVTFSITAADDAKAAAAPQSGATQNVTKPDVPKTATDAKDNATQVQVSNTTAGSNPPTADSNKTENATNVTTTEKTAPKSDVTNPNSTTNAVVPEKKNETVPIPSKGTNKTTPIETSSSSSTISSTTTSTTTTTIKPHIEIEKGRAFDGPSFIGGMVLTLGLIAIGFMGFKYYKTRTERNYHTL